MVTTFVVGTALAAVALMIRSLPASYYHGPLGTQDYERSLQWAVANLAIVSDFQKSTESAQHTITYYDARYGQTRWNSIATVLGGRFRVTLHFDVRIDYATGAVTPTQEPEYLINEVAEVTRDSSGRVESTSFGRQWRLPEGEWRSMVESGFEALRR